MLTADLTALALTIAVALGAGLLMVRLGWPAFIGYLLVGIVAGPGAARLVSGVGVITAMADLGAVLVLFLIGLELSLRSFRTVLREVLPTAAALILLALLFAFAIGALAGWPARTALLMAFLGSLGSAAMAVPLLQQTAELRSRTGRIAIGLLLAGALALAPMLVLVEGLGRTDGRGWIVALRLVAAVALLGALIWVLLRRRRLILPIGDWLRSRPELLPVAALGLAFAAATLTGLAGLGAAYGAFLAGLAIGNCGGRGTVTRALLPLRSLLPLALFLPIGLMVDLRLVWSHLGIILAFVILLPVARAALATFVLRLLGQRWERAFPAALATAPFGELSYVLLAAGFAALATDAVTFGVGVAIVALSLLTAPLWQLAALRFDAVADRGIVSMQAALAETFARELALLRIGAAHAARWLGIAWTAVRQLVARLRGVRLRPAGDPPLLPPPGETRR